MTMRLGRTLTAVALTAGLSVAASGALHAERATNAASISIAGTWTMHVNGPHGAMSMSLVLKQDGKKVTGTWANPHGGDLPLEGEFADNTLKVATTSNVDEDNRLTFTAKLKDDGTLEGYLSASMGDMTWTAERAKDKR